MADNKDIDFDTLPSSSDELMDDDLDELDNDLEEDTSFDDEGDLSSSEDGEGEDEDEDEDEDEAEYEDEGGVDEDEDEDEEDEDEDEDEDSQGGSKLKDIAIYGGGGIVVIGVGAIYLQSVLGFSIFGGVDDSRPPQAQNSRSDIAERSDQLRESNASDIIADRDSSNFDISGGWDDEDDELTPEEPNPGFKVEEGIQKDVPQPAIVMAERQQDLNHASDKLVERFKIEIKEVVDEAVGGLLTRSYFDSSIGEMESSIKESFNSVVSSTEKKVESYIENASKKSQKGSLFGVVADSEVIIDDLDGRKRLPGLNVLDASTNGEMSVVQNADGGTSVLSAGDSFKSGGKEYTVTGIQDSGRVVLVNNGRYIDAKRVDEKTPEASSSTTSRPTRTQSEGDREKTVARFKAEKTIADKLKRDYGVHKLNYSDLSHDKESRERGKKPNEDFVISHLPPGSESVNEISPNESFVETPRQSELIIAEGWKGSMIMGDEFLVTDPNGQWRKLKKGDRVVGLGNNLVHGLDSKNNLIIGNRVILFN